jgi:type II secretory ATPase GspE/PulE/Tfp pilus assembly ATPase PilB-like protein
MNTRMTPAHGNPRPIEPRLAPRFHALLAAHPPQPDQPRTQERAEALLTDAVLWKASDIHIEPSTNETRLRFRVDGVLHDAAAVPNFSGHRLAAFFKTLSQIDALALAKPEHGHGRMEAAGTLVELRTTVAPTIAGEMLGIRLLDTNRPLLRLDDIGMSDSDQQTLRAWLEGMQGMLLVGGPVGSGKTSTLYALLHELQKLPRSILTVEDPVESNLDGITQIEVNPKRGLFFPEAIRAMLRLDPDFLLVGEIRDPESAHVAITAAGSGHALLSTIHARDAVGTVTTLRNVGAKNWEIAAALEVCVSQRLVRRLCSACKEEAPATEEDQAHFAAIGEAAPDTLMAARGCNDCAGTGFSGRIGVFELWRVDAVARQWIADGADDLALARYALQHGLRPLLHDALAKVAAGHTTLAEIRPIAAEGSRATTAYAVS